MIMQHGLNCLRSLWFAIERRGGALLTKGVSSWQLPSVGEGGVIEGKHSDGEEISAAITKLVYWKVADANTWHCPPGPCHRLILSINQSKPVMPKRHWSTPTQAGYYLNFFVLQNVSCVLLCVRACMCMLLVQHDCFGDIRSTSELTTTTGASEL